MKYFGLATAVGGLALAACGGNTATFGEGDVAGSGGSSAQAGSGGATGSQAASGSGEAGSSTGGPAGSTGAGGNAEPFVTLIDATWSLGGGDEGYHCARLTLEDTVYIKAFRALAPLGTHHTVVTLTDGSQPDGEFSCGAGTLSDQMLYASGVGTDDLYFPEGVAMKVEAGQQILLNLHLFNTSVQGLDGVSGTEVQLASADEVEQEAEMIFAGTLAIAILPMQQATAGGTCKFKQDATILSVWPHMHQYGRHMTVGHGGAVLHDAPFDFYEQVNFPIEPRLVKAGESVRVDCTWQNTGNSLVTFGDSSTQEMCFAGLYRYPAAHDGLFCDLPL